MVPMSSTRSHEFTPEQRETLLALAEESIEKGLYGEQTSIDPVAYPGVLAENGASFVTLNKNQQLRGCIGSLEAHQPLVIDVASNAYSAAFRDPRFSPLVREELPELAIHISVLTSAEPMHFDSEASLLEQLQPHVDGLILTAGPRRGTFLPSVWESLPDAREFLRQLKWKAGLPTDYWGSDIRVERYRTVSISR